MQSTFLSIDSRLKGLNLTQSEKIVLSYLIGWVRYNKGQPNGGKVNLCYRTSKAIADACELSESGVKKIISNLVEAKTVKVGQGDLSHVEIRPPMISKIVGRTSNYSLENETLLEIAGITKEEAVRTKSILDQERDGRARRVVFYEKLNSADSLKDFAEALGNIPHDLGAFLFGWSLAYRKTQGNRFVWDTRSYGILKGYWRGATYGRARPFDYWRLEKFFRNENGKNFMRPHAEDEEAERESSTQGRPSIQAFLHFDKGLLYRDQSTDLSDCIKNPKSLFYLPESSTANEPESTLQAKQA